MPRKHNQDAIVLRTYNVADADRYCILLTQDMGRLPARANGVRKVLSRRCGALLPLHRVHVTLEERSGGYVIADAACVDTHSDSWQSLAGFACVSQGIELLLKFTADGEPLPDIYELTADFLSLAADESAHERLLPLFAMKLLMYLGLAPTSIGSLDDTMPAGQIVGPMAELVPIIAEKSLSELLPLEYPINQLSALVQRLVGIQLGSALSAQLVASRLSPGATPICQ